MMHPIDDAEDPEHLEVRGPVLENFDRDKAFVVAGLFLLGISFGCLLWLMTRH